MFTARVEGAAPASWDAPAPVEGWTARDVVRHLVEWFPGFLESGAGVRLESATSVDDDPVAAWHELADASRLLADPATPDKALSNPHIGDVPLDQAISRFFTADVFMHTWDLARATGQDDALDPVRCAETLAGMEPLDEMLRASGQYGPGRGGRRRRSHGEADGLHRTRPELRSRPRLRSVTSQPARSRATLTGISSRAWEHPADRGALVALRKLKGFDTVLKAFSGLINERKVRLDFLGSGIRVDDRQFAGIARLLAEVARTLDVTSCPRCTSSTTRSPTR